MTLHADKRAEQVELTVLMPCLNEAETLEICVKKALGFMERHEVRGEVLIADNGSTDGSQDIARSLGARVVPIESKGYGAALTGGIGAAFGHYIIMGDSDDSYDFVNLMPFLERLRAGDELVMGNRFKGGIAPGAMPPLHRYLGNPVLTAIGRLFFRSPCGDFHCGLRGFNADSIRALDLKSTGMEFASEMVVKATLQDLRLSEVATTLSPDGRTRPPHLRSWRDGWRHLRFLLLYSPRWLFFYPGLALLLLGLLAMAAVLPGPLALGAVTFDVHTLLLGGVLAVLGGQAITFAALAKQFAVRAGLLPVGSRLTSTLLPISLETVLLVGGALVALGLVGILAGVWVWQTVQFGDLQTGNMMRLLVPSTTAIVLGFQVMLTGFFRSLLDLGTV